MVYLALVTGGCGSQEPLEMSAPSTVPNVDRRSDLRQALDFLNRLDEFQPLQAQRKIRDYLQPWLKLQPPHPDWIADPLARRLPKRFQPLVAESQLVSRELDGYDVQMLQEAVWLRDIAQSVVRQSSVPPDLQQLYEATAPRVDPDRQSDLLQALRLFDWTVRNLQLEEIERDGQQRFGSVLILQAWESLLMGRGTLEEKSRVFILLARQVGLPVVMLARRASETDATPAPWLPAVLLGEQLYLLDMRLGLAVLGPDGQGVATLQQVLQQPTLLQQMAESADAAYPISAGDLKSLVALVDATPGYLSQRMRILESALLGEQKTVLSVAPTPLATAVRRCQGISQVEIWTQPYEAFTQRSQLTPDSPEIIGLAQEHALFDRRTPLHQARLLHFRGQVDDRDDRPGARALYLECRAPEAQIESIRQALRARAASSSSGQTEAQQAEQQNQVRELEQLMVRTKQNASYWLGLIAFDRGEYQVASDYFEKRLLTPDPTNLWAAGARYNLGRCWEALGWRDRNVELLQRAVQTYQAVENSPLTAGCRVRARWLTERLAAGPNPEKP